MTGLNDRLAQQIDTALLVPSFDGSEPRAVATLAQLFALTSDYLGLAVPPDARTAAAEVAAIAQPGKLQDNAEERFRVALLTLRDSLAEQKELESTTSQLAGDPEMVQEFLVEAREHLATVEAGMLRLERNTKDAEALHAVFRSFHTVKGLAGFLGARAIQELAHETESVLDLARSGKLSLNPELTDLILRSADELNRCLTAAEKQPLNELPRCNPQLLDSLAAMLHGEGVHGDSVVIDADIDKDSGVVDTPAEASPDLAFDAPAAAGPAEGPAKAAAAGGNVLRVDAAKLEYLVDMVGELVIAESVVRNDPLIAQAESPLLSRNLAQLARVVKEVQKTSMSMRMVAVGTLFAKMTRLVRDLSRKSHKIVELVTVGDEVELDRTIVEELADPMVHMIRNAVDHGLETPEERLRAGKPEQGIVRIRAMHEAGDIVIELSDNGRGLNTAKILAKAQRLGMAGEGMVGENGEANEEAIFPLIFEPGFSTADNVTDLSGRGVGMDVVRKKIQKLRGRVTIHSVSGQGCTFVIRLPLTLAIIDGLVVGVGSQRYILPMFAVREMFSPKDDTFVTLENRMEAALFRNKLLPVIRLSRLIEGHKGDGHKDETREGDRDGGVLIVAEGRDQLFCIAVDQLIGKQEVVVKSLGKTYRDVPAIAGGAILGDGRVGLVIDVNALRYQRQA